MPIRSTGVLLLGAAFLAACFPLEPDSADPDASIAADSLDTPVTEPIEPVSVQSRRAEIDWAQAQADFAARDLPEDGDAFGVASGGTSPSVPVLLPSQPITAASADGRPSFKVVPLADGYYAVFDGEAYDMIINGSDRLAPHNAGDPSLDPEAFRFEETITGAQVSFKRYGASYLVEFNCNGRRPGPDGNCVDEPEAIAAVQDLLISGTQ